MATRERSILVKKKRVIKTRGYKLKKKAVEKTAEKKPEEKRKPMAEVRLEARRKLFEDLVRKEGQTSRELWEDSLLTLREIEDHLKYLLRENFLESRGRGPNKRYYPKVTILVGPVDKRTMEALSTTEARRAVLFLMAEPGKEAFTIAKALGLDRKKVSRALAGLVRAGIVTKIGRPGRYSLSQKVVRVMIKDKTKRSFFSRLFSGKYRGG